MGLRCTVFGHSWGGTDTEREREEDGSEVVTTVREVRTCRRCGAEDVLGTSKEVTSIEGSAATDSVPDSRDAETTRDEAPGDDGTAYDPETDDGVILDDDADADADRGPREWPNHPDREDDDPGEPSPWPETARESEDEPREERFVGADRKPDDRGEDDGDLRPGSDRADRPDAGEADSDSDDGSEIIDVGDEGDETGRDGDRDAIADGSTPESSEGRVEAPTDAGAGHDEAGGAADEETLMGPDATHRPDDDAEVLEATEPNEQSRATAREPVDPADHTADPDAAAPDDAPSLDPSDPVSDDEPSPEDVEFYCAECDYVDDSRWPSRRAGDVCPRCQRSYLSERRT